MRLRPRSFALGTALASAGVVFAVCLLGFVAIYWREQSHNVEVLRDSVRSSLTSHIYGIIRPKLTPDEQEPSCAELRYQVDVLNDNKDGPRAWLHPLDQAVHECTNGNAPFRLNQLPLDQIAQGQLTLSQAAQSQIKQDQPTCQPFAQDQGDALACGLVLPTAQRRPEQIMVVVVQLMKKPNESSVELFGPLLLMLVAALAAFGVGYAANRGLERRLAQVSAAAEAVIGGDLTRRMPMQGTDDEFDRLVGTVNAVLARVEALVAGMRQVTENIAHDLRTPLTRVCQMLEAALLAPRDAATDAETLQRVNAGLQDVLGTFQALLRIAGIEAATAVQDAPAETVDLAEVVTWVGETFQPVAEQAGQQLEYHSPPGLVVQGDVAMLRDAVANLVWNALVHGGPTVHVRLAAAPTPEGGAFLQVADDGPGIPENEREKVLGRFYRLDRSRSAPGSGLGLSLVDAMARLHGAKLSLGDAAPGLLVSLAFPPPRRSAS
jgi:signal transduction histidine kinase